MGEGQQMWASAGRWEEMGARRVLVCGRGAGGHRRAQAGGGRRRRSGVGRRRAELGGDVQRQRQANKLGRCRQTGQADQVEAAKGERKRAGSDRVGWRRVQAGGIGQSRPEGRSWEGGCGQRRGGDRQRQAQEGAGGRGGHDAGGRGRGWKKKNTQGTCGWMYAYARKKKEKIEPFAVAFLVEFHESMAPSRDEKSSRTSFTNSSLFILVVC